MSRRHIFEPIAQAAKYRYIATDPLDFTLRDSPISRGFRFYETMGDGNTAHTPDMPVQMEMLPDYLYSLAAAIMENPEIVASIGFDIRCPADEKEIAFADTVRFLAQSSLSGRWRDTQNQFLTIGSDTGLRGYGINEFAGVRVFSFQFETRTLPYPIWVIRLGAVVFYDLGGAADSFPQLTLHQDAGLGLRMLIPQTSAQLVKFDFAVPFDGTGRGTIRGRELRK